MNDFQTLLADAERHKDNRCCAPIAVAVLTGNKFRTVQNWFSKLGRRIGRGTPRWMTYQVLKNNGYELRRCEKMEKRFRTVRTLERNVSKRANLLVFTRGHALAIKNGKVQDWTKGRLNRIQKIYIVEKA